MSKKLLSVILALALVVSCFAVSAFAIGDYGYESGEDAANYKQTWALGEPVNNGDGTYSVDVKLTANYKVGPIQFKVVTDVTAGSLTLGDVIGNKQVIPADWKAEVAFEEASGKVMIIPKPTIDAVSGIDNPVDKVIATLIFDAEGQVAATVKIDIDPKKEDNALGTLLAARMSDGNVVTGAAIVGQTVTNVTDPSVTIGNASTPPKLVVKEGTIGVIDESRKDLNDVGDNLVDGYIYGVEPDYDNVNQVTEVFEVVGDGTINVIPTEKGEGTGTIVQVLDLDGNVVSEYVLIIFGDVNGDGIVLADDATIILLHDVYGYYENGAWGILTQPSLIFAGDVNGDTNLIADDATKILLHDVYGYYENDAWGRLLQSEVIASLA